MPKAQRTPPAPSDDFWYQSTSLNSAHVTPDSAIQNVTVYVCARLIADTISTLPLDMYRRLPNNGREKYSNHPLQEVIKHTPNPYQTGTQFWDWMARCCIFRGGAYAEIKSGRRGAVDQLIPLHPDYIQTEMLDNLKLRYTYNDPRTKQKRVILQSEMLYIPMFTLDGITPASPITVHSKTIGLAISATEYGTQFYDNKAMPGGVIERTAEFKTVEQKEAFKADFEKSFTGSNQHKTAVLPMGVTYKPLSITNEDAQFLETRRFQRTEIAAIYGVHPSLVNEMEGATFSNIEEQNRVFLQLTINPWLVRIEQAIRKSLIIAPDTYFAEFNTDGLLRGDTKARAEMYSKALGSGGHAPWMTQNEIRAKENMNPIGGGDELINPLNQQNGITENE